MSDAMLDLKGEMLMLNVMHLHGSDLKQISKQIMAKRDEMPQFFERSPVVVDCTALGDQFSQLNLNSLRAILIDAGFVPVGIRGVDVSQESNVSKSGWSLMRPSAGSTKKAAPKKKPVSQEEPDRKPVAKDAAAGDAGKEASESEHVVPATVVSRPLRSGMQAYSESDVISLSPTSAGSEIMAGGSVHVYGALRGRAMAGIHGDTTARIFCRSLEAEMIAIAGRYQLLDEGDTDLKGKPAMISLDGEKLMIDPLD